MAAPQPGTPPSEKAQRLRLRFARGEEASAIGHLDLSRIWTAAFQAAGAVISYSQGNRPHPRLTFAAGLPLGVVSDAELLDVVLARRADPAGLVPELERHLPPGLSPSVLMRPCSRTSNAIALARRVDVVLRLML